MEKQISYFNLVAPEYWEELESKWGIGKWDRPLWKHIC